MKFLPYENITYHTKLNSSEILHRIDEVIQPLQSLKILKTFSSNKHKPYEGSISGESFTMIRMIDHKNSFIPIIKGNIATDADKNTIKVTMRLQTPVIVFLCIWFGFISIFLFNLPPSSFENGIFNKSIFMPLAMLIFVYAMTIGGFKHESIKSKKYLAELLEADFK